MTLDEMIQESIETWKPLEFKREDLEETRFKLISWTSLEVEKEINRLWEKWYVPMGWVACTYTSHGLVYAMLMENLYYNFTPDETQTSSEDSRHTELWSADWEWWVSTTWTSEDWGGETDGHSSWELYDWWDNWCEPSDLWEVGN